jgi:predicted acetyltransferase
MELLRPGPEHLASYCAALAQGWSPNTTRPEAAQEALLAIEADAAAYLATTHDPEGLGPPVTLPDGSQVPRLPGVVRWMWDEARERGDEGFCGVISLRWAKDLGPLPPYVLGHIGYTVVPWQQRRGHATRALGQLLPLARGFGLREVDLTTDTDNLPSQRVITANGGVLVEAFTKPAAYGGTPGLRFRITL